MTNQIVSQVKYDKYKIPKCLNELKKCENGSTAFRCNVNGGFKMS